MKISERTLAVLAKLITGDSKLSPYRGGPKLVRLFNEFGFNDHYGNGFPSRWVYTEQNLRELNGKPALRSLVDTIFDAREFLDTEFQLAPAAQHLNQYLKYDGFEMTPDDGHFKAREIGAVAVKFETPYPASKEISHIFIQEQSRKCDKKIEEGDYDGAITNARSLAEAVLIEIETQLSPDKPQYDGDLVKLYKRVQSLLNLEPARKDISDTLRQALSGLTSIVCGLAGLRNKMGDARGSRYKPSKHHAKLAANAAKTLSDFFFDTYAYQKDSGKISNKKSALPK